MNTLISVRILGIIEPIDAIKVDNSRKGATLRSLCASVDIARHAQAARIKRNPKLASALISVVIDTPGGPQATEVLLDWAIPIWASGLQTTRLSEEKQAVAVILKEEAMAAIERAFTQLEQEAPARAAEIPASDLHQIKQELSLLVEGLDIRRVVLLLIQYLGALEAEQQELRSQIENLSTLDAERQAEQARAAEQARKYQALAGRVVGVEEWLMSLDRRMTAGGQGSAATSAQLPSLSAAHLLDARTLFRLLAETTGRTQAQLAQELSETFRAAAIEVIPDELWPDVLAWCWWRAQQPH